MRFFERLYSGYGRPTDSFTYNLVDLIRTLNIPFNVVNVETISLEQAEAFSHFLISPGPDVPEAYPQLFHLLQHFYRNKPILGVCLIDKAGGRRAGQDGARLWRQRHLRHWRIVRRGLAIAARRADGLERGQCRRAGQYGGSRQKPPAGAAG